MQTDWRPAEQEGVPLVPALALRLEVFDVAFKQREKKRKKLAAMEAARGKARGSGRSSRWWLTLVKRDTCCARCGRMLREGREMVYRASPREALCVGYAERDGVSWRPSVAWERAALRKLPKRRDVRPGTPSSPTPRSASTAPEGSPTDREAPSSSRTMAFATARGASSSEDHESWQEAQTARTLNGMGQAGTNGALAAEPMRSSWPASTRKGAR